MAIPLGPHFKLWSREKSTEEDMSGTSTGPACGSPMVTRPPPTKSQWGSTISIYFFTQLQVGRALAHTDRVALL